jgi:hypothetical protein
VCVFAAAVAQSKCEKTKPKTIKQTNKETVVSIDFQNFEQTMGKSK